MKKILSLAALLCLLAIVGCRKNDAARNFAKPVDTNVQAEETITGRQPADSVQADTVTAKPLSEAEQFGKRLKEEKWSKDDYGFRYPAFMSEKTTYMNDMVADVTVYSSGPVSLCLWPMIGSWATSSDAYPVKGSILSPDAKIASITYQARRSDIHSGYTDDGRIFYLKRRIIEGDAVNHAQVLVTIYPKDYKDQMDPLVKEVQNW